MFRFVISKIRYFEKFCVFLKIATDKELNVITSVGRKTVAVASCILAVAYAQTYNKK